MTSVVFCTPTPKRAYDVFISAMERSVPALDEAGIEHQMVFEIGSPYISWARANMLKKAMETNADTFVFLDHDLSWKPQDLMNLVEHPGDVAAGTYRYKYDTEEYMGNWAVGDDSRPVVRPDGTIVAHAIPAGFLKVTRAAVERFREAYPELQFGNPNREFIDLFNHGAFEGLWWGEDYAFSRRWRAIGGDIHLIPDLDINHHTLEHAYLGNLHQFLLRQPGGSLAKAA